MTPNTPSYSSPNTVPTQPKRLPSQMQLASMRLQNLSGAKTANNCSELQPLSFVRTATHWRIVEKRELVQESFSATF